MSKHDLRCKGTKTDQDLLNEYFGLVKPLEYFSYGIGSYTNNNYEEELEKYNKRKELLEKELGKEAIEKERLERRLKSLENRLNRLEQPKKWFR